MSAPRSRCFPAHRHAAGFTLTELLISLVLGLFTVTAVISVLVGGSETFRTTDALSRMQENGRFALEIMRRDLREAGFTGCRRSLRPELPRPPAGTTPLDVGLVRNTLSPAPPDALSFAFTFTDPIMGYEATGDGTGNSWTAGDPSIPATPADPIIGALDDSDIVIAVTPRGPGVGVAVPPGPPVAPDFDIPIEPGSDIVPGDVVMVTDCSRAAITQITATGGGALLSHAVGAVDEGPGNYRIDIGGPFGAGSEVFPIERVAYYVANSPVTGRRALFRNAQEIASDVEDLEVEYGVDTNADLRIDQYVDAATVGAVGVPGPPWEGVLATRVHLLLSSGEEDNLAEQPVVGLNYAGGSFDAPAGDRRLFQVFSTTVSLRNRLR